MIKDSKEKYENPMLEIIRFATEDIITTSSTPNRPTEDNEKVDGTSKTEKPGDTPPTDKVPDDDVHTACYKDEQGRWFDGTEKACTVEDLGCDADEELYHRDGEVYCGEMME